MNASSIAYNNYNLLRHPFDGTAYNFFFHSNVETDPWFMGDLGEVFTIIGGMFYSRGEYGGKRSLYWESLLLGIPTDVI